ncbi:MAG: hypothetical protein LBB72_07820 [Spirochaetaceae bacterium]|jgi:hypothetical protein|nr:hypothetical protein [Spirochaetaceae bacterium]
MKNKTFIALFTALLAVVLVLSGCSAFSGPAAPAGDGGTLALTVKGVGAGGRTIMPELTYKATITPAGDDAVAIDKTLVAGVNIIKLEPGTYGIVVKAYNGEVLVAQGSKTGVVVTAEAAASAEITLTAETLTGKGTFAWDLSLFSDAEVAAIAIFKLTDVDLDTFEFFDEFEDADELIAIAGKDEIPVTDPTTLVEKGFVDSIELDAEEYLVYFFVQNDAEEDDPTVWSEVLRIYAGLKSSYQPSFENIFGGEGKELEDLIIAAIAEGDYDITAPELTAIGVAGVSAGNINDIKTNIGLILAAAGNEAPEDLDGLKELVDAALVMAGAVGVDPASPIKDTEIADLAANDSDVDVDWDDWDEPDYEVTITVGAYEFTVSILPIAEPEFLESLEIAQVVPVYRFALPSGETYGNYKAIKITVKDADPTANIRFVRLMGNYSASDFAWNAGSGVLVADFNSGKNAEFIYDDIGAGAITAAGGAADTWYTLTFRLVGNSPNGSFVAANKPADSATGPFYFGVGVPGNDNSIKTELIKNITMVHKADPKKNVVLDELDFFGFAGYPIATSLGLSSRSVVANDDYDDPASVTLQLDLTKFLDDGTVLNGSAHLDATTEVGKLIAEFTKGNSRACVEIGETQVTQIMAAKSLKIYVDASSTDTTSNFRYHLGNPVPSGGWNGSASFGGAPFYSVIYGGKAVGFQGDPNHIAANFGYFILQYQGGDVADGEDPVTVTIKSIKIKLIN